MNPRILVPRFGEPHHVCDAKPIFIRRPSTMNSNSGNSSTAVSAASKGAEQTGKAQEKASIRNRAMHECHNEKPTNEYVLNVAFFSFLGFTAVQTGFAIAANSAAMMQDSEAMVITYSRKLHSNEIIANNYSLTVCGCPNLFV